MTTDAERHALAAFLDAQRRSAIAIVDGLDDRDMDRSVVPSGWTPRELIAHLTGAERFWFGKVLGGAFDATGHPDEVRSSRQLLDNYRRQTERSNEILAGYGLDAPPSGEVLAGMEDEIRTARDIVLHMIEETARHAGHLDIARELIDGKTGLGPR